MHIKLSYNQLASIGSLWRKQFRFPLQRPSKEKATRRKKPYVSTICKASFVFGAYEKCIRKQVHTSAIRVPSGPDRTGPTAAIVRSSFPKIRHNRSPDKTYHPETGCTRRRQKTVKMVYIPLIRLGPVPVRYATFVPDKEQKRRTETVRKTERL